MVPRFRKRAPVERTRPADEQCRDCGHWSIATESGLDDRSGYCDRWEKITSRDFWCEEFVSKSDYDKYQQELADEAEDWLDDDS